MSDNVLKEKKTAPYRVLFRHKWQKSTNICNISVGIVLSYLS